MEGILIYSGGSLIALLSLLQTDIPSNYLAIVAITHAVVLFIAVFITCIFLSIKNANK